MSWRHLAPVASHLSLWRHLSFPPSPRGALWAGSAYSEGLGSKAAPLQHSQWSLLPRSLSLDGSVACLKSRSSG